jgi:hypothetical protein
MIARLTALARAWLAKLRGRPPAAVLAELPLVDDVITEEWTPGDPGIPIHGRRRPGRRTARA